MNDYSISGPFGEVVFAPAFKTTGCDALDKIVYAGYHKVNDLYRIDRADGIENWLILLTVDGAGKAYVGDKRFILSQNTAFIIPPGVKSGYRAVSGGSWEFYWIHIDGRNAKALCSYITDNYDNFIEMKNGEAVKTMKDVISAKTAVQRNGIFAAKSVGSILFSLLSSLETDDGSADQRTAQIADYINDNLDKPFSLKETCEHFYISEEYLIRLFKKNMSVTPYNYYRSLKIERAAKYLTYTSMTIKEIAALSGYKSTSSFSIQFTKVYELSPQKYRKLYKVYHN